MVNRCALHLKAGRKQTAHNENKRQYERIYYKIRHGGDVRRVL